jgi:dolichol-phosphate mannosyltransferase
MKDLDILIPVHNEGENIGAVLESLRSHVKTRCRILICFDMDDDDTLPVVRELKDFPFEIKEVKNRKKGVLGAITTGFEESDASAVIVFPADDTVNAVIIDRMNEKFREGCEIVAASRFIQGGCMEGCPWLKGTLVRVASFTLHYLAGIPINDVTNGFKLFSRHLLDTCVIESREGFTYAIELVVKAHRLGWKIGEVPARWYERNKGRSRFRLFKWLFPYMRWYFYGFMSRFVRKK